MEIIQQLPLSVSSGIEVRIWHDDAYGMQAEPLNYHFGSQTFRNGSGDTADQMIKTIVREHYTERELEYIRETDPAFDEIPFEVPPISQQEFQHDRI